MANINWASAITSYAIEGSLESLIIFAIIQGVLVLKRVTDPAIIARFLTLPLIIPALLSPTFHFLFPQLDESALVVQLENAVPWIDHMHAGDKTIAAPLLALFLLILSFNFIRALVVTWLEWNASNKKPQLRLKVERTLAGLVERMSVPLPVVIISTQRSHAAYTFGIRRPVITLGSQCLHCLDDEELEAVLAHEIAHFKRNDPITLLFITACRDLMFFNPLAHFIYNRICELREQAADDLGLKATSDPLALASSLIKFLHWQQPSLPNSASVGFSPRVSLIEARIQRVLYSRASGQGISESTSGRLFYSLAIVLTITLSLV
jgi:Zn-dependent protease with chaperone function